MTAAPADGAARAGRRADRPRGSEPAADRAPDWVAAGTPQPLRCELEALLGADRVLARATRPGPLRLRREPLPPVPEGRRDGARRRRRREGARLRAANAASPVTLRSGGTSLNGQGQSDGILVDVRRHFTGVDGRGRRRARAGAARAPCSGTSNRVLAPHGRKLGPDPASTDFATVGGVIANNSGGMRCGVDHDSYSTVRSLTLVLPSGTVIDTAAPGAEERFAEARARARAGPDGDPRRDPRRRRARGAHPAQVPRSRTPPGTGCARSSTPTRRSRSSGGWWSARRARWRSSPRRCSRPCRCCRAPRSRLVHFADIEAAAEPVPDLVAAGASAVELMVAPALIAAGHTIPGHARVLAGAAAGVGGAAGRVPRRRPRASSTRSEAAAARALSRRRELLRRPEFTRDAELTEVSWRVREGMHGIVGQAAAPGHGADHRGRLRAARADRRVGDATSRRCSASTAS